jgi:hypothetical protein
VRASARSICHAGHLVFSILAATKSSRAACCGSRVWASVGDDRRRAETTAAQRLGGRELVAKTADWLGSALRQSRWRRARKPASSECSPFYHIGRFQPRCPELEAASIILAAKRLPRESDNGFTCPSRAVSGPAEAVCLLTRRILTLASQRCNGVRRRYAAMPQDIDGAVARWRKASGLARRNSLIMRPANTAKRRRVALLPCQRVTAQDSAPDDDKFQVRKASAFPCGLGLEARSGPCVARSRAKAKRRWRARWEIL